MKTTSIFFLFIAVVMAGCTKIDNENGGGDNENGGGNNWKPNLGDYDPVPLSDFDNDFYKWCVREFDATGDGILQYGEIKKIEKILFYREGVTLKSLNGIKYFTSLKYLEDYNGATCDLTSLDVSYNTLLDTLNLGKAPDLQYLTVGKHPSLKYIYLDDSYIQNMDLSDCSSLQCINVHCINLNISGCKALKEIYVSELRGLLGINTCTSLEGLYISGNSYYPRSLDVSGLKNLRYLVYNYGLTSLNVNGCTALEAIEVSNNRLKALDLIGLENIQTLCCSRNELTSLDLSGLENLYYLACGENKLTSLDVSMCTALEYLSVEENKLKTLDVSANTELKTFHANNTPLSTLYVWKGWRKSLSWIFDYDNVQIIEK